MRRHGSLATAGAGAAIAVLLAYGAACSADEKPSPQVPHDVRTAKDPTTGVGVRAHCVVADPDGEVILHPGAFTVLAATRLDGAQLVDPANIEIVERSVVGYSGPIQLQGVVLDYPPLENAGIADALADWETRRPLEGLTVTPADGKQAVLVAVRLVDPGSPGHLRGVHVDGTRDDYDDDLSWEQLLLVVPAGELCTIDRVAATTEWTR